MTDNSKKMNGTYIDEVEDSKLIVFGRQFGEERYVDDDGNVDVDRIREDYVAFEDGLPENPPDHQMDIVKETGEYTVVESLLEDHQTRVENAIESSDDLPGRDNFETLATLLHVAPIVADQYIEKDWDMQGFVPILYPRSGE